MLRSILLSFLFSLSFNYVSGNTQTSSQTCDFSIVNDPFTEVLSFCVNEPIEPFTLEISTNCTTTGVNIAVQGLPSGIDYTQNSTDQGISLSFQGVPTTADVAFVNITVSTDNFQSSTGGMITIDGNCNGAGTGNESCDFSIVNDPFTEVLSFCVNEPIEPFTLEISTNCTTTGVNIAVQGLPSGIDYTQNSTDQGISLSFQGVPTTADVAFVNITVSTDNFQSSTGGMITIDGNCNGAGTGNESCDFSIVNDPFTEVLSFCVNEPIEPFTLEISTNCTTTGVNIAVQGLPSGIDYTQNSTDQGISLSFQGVPTTADVAFVNITVSTDNFQSSTGGMITIDGNCNGAGTGNESCDFSIVNDPFTEVLSFCVNEPIEPFTLEISTNCTTTGVNIAVQGLPSGIDYTQNSTDQGISLSFQGVPTTADVAFVNITVSTDNFQSSTGGMITIDGNCNGAGTGNESCDFSIVNDPFTEVLSFCVNEPIEPFTLEISTNCTTTGVNIAVQGLPSGIDYTQNSTDQGISLSFQGVPTTADVAFVNITVSTDNFQSSTGGMITIDGNCNGAGTGNESCDFSIVNDPFTEVLSFCVNEPIEPFTLEISTNCTTTGVNIAVQGLPSGIDYTQNSTDQGISLSFQGVPTTADVAFVNITVSTDNFQSSTGGMITIDGNCNGAGTGNESCDFSIVNDPFTEVLSFCVNEPIEPFTLEISTNCTTTGVNIAVQGLPSGIDYTQNSTDQGISLSFQGVPTTADVAFVNITVSTDNFQSSTGGMITIDGNCNGAGTGNESCDFSIVNDPFTEVLSFCVNEPIEPFTLEISTNCTTTGVNIAVQGLPSGIDYTQNSTDQGISLSFQGVPTTADVAFVNITVSTDNFQSSTGGMITIDGNCNGAGTGNESCDFSIVNDPFTEVLSFCVNEPIEPFTLEISTNCTTTGVNIAVQGLPSGIDYTQNSTDQGISLSFQGVPTTADVAFVNITVSTDNFQSSTGGMITIDGNCNGAGTGNESCDFSIVNDPFTEVLSFCVNEPIEPFTLEISTNCTTTGVNIAVQGLPSGIDYTQNSTDQGISLSFQGVPTTADVAFVNITVSTDNFQSSTGGMITIDGNCNGAGTGNESCDFSIVNDPFTEVLSFCVNEPIEPFTLEISTNCTTTGVNIAVQGLPSGIDYTQNSTDQGISLSFQGVPTTADVAFVNITVSTDNFQSSTGGMITIDGNCNGAGSETGTGTTSNEECSLAVEKSLREHICIDEEIEPIRFDLTSNCSSTLIDIIVIGLPPGLSYEMNPNPDNREFVISGTAFIPGEYSVTVLFYDVDNYVEYTLNGNIYVDSDCNASETNNQNDRDGDGIEDRIDECPNTQEGIDVDEKGCAVSNGECSLELNEKVNAGESTTLCLGSTMDRISFVISSNCNNAQLDALVEGLPPGIDYFFYQTPYEKEFVLYGEPFIPGTFKINIIISDLENGNQKAISKVVIVNNDCVSDNSNTTSSTFEDQDNDGIADDQDECPDTRPGIAVDPKGCSSQQQTNSYLGDDDGDGIYNILDACPNTSSNTKVDPKGCSLEQGGESIYFLDADSDGVIDLEDVCPDTENGVEVDDKGCSQAQLNQISDFDQDGVDNNFDLCPNTPQGQKVDENGCALVDQDKDLDGVDDEIDACPNTPAGEYVDDYGCSVAETDSDFDGVNNEIDQCPNSPPGIAVNEYGCSEAEEAAKNAVADDDQDGVINKLDRCPDTPAGTATDENGCTPEESDEQESTDNDLDGVDNENDLCPETEPGVSVNEFGCPLSELDSDFDKVSDQEDLCPNTPVGERVNQFGCSVSQKENDLDMDGVPNEKDYCSNTLPYFEVNTNGCAEVQIIIDSDFDGIPNEVDQCNNTAPLKEVNEHGCSQEQLDDDNDGVINSIDRCPDTVSGEKVGPYGCAEIEIDGDDDQDGVPNSIDKCPGTPSDETVDTNGCPFLPPNIKAQSFEQTENSRDVETESIRSFLGRIIYDDPNASDGSTNNITLSILETENSQLFELVGDSVFLIGRTDFEENLKLTFTINAVNNFNQSTLQEMVLNVQDIPNTESISNFVISVFNVENEASGAKVSYKRYFNPKADDRGVGKWKIKKKIVGGNDAHLFTIKSASLSNGKLNAEGDYLDFITPPDHENPMDHNRDNIYEVDVVNINTNDGEATQPISVQQTNLVVPENTPTAIELQSVPAAPTDDTDGDGINDIVDNSPFVANPDQMDTDGDGVGDVTDDADHDGVWNPFDECNETPYNTIVDAKGCAVFSLPPNAFAVSKAEKCIDENSINISFASAGYAYNVSLNGTQINTAPIQDSSIEIPELSSGTYMVCITIEGKSSDVFERCYSVNIDTQDALSVYSNKSNEGKTVDYSLKGGKVYTITQNGMSFQTTESKVRLTLVDGYNEVKITTGIECQGIFEETHFNSSEVLFSPVPFNDYLTIFVGGNDRDIVVSIYSSNGRLISCDQHYLNTTNRLIKMNTDHLRQGSYVIKLEGATTIMSELIIKE